MPIQINNDGSVNVSSGVNVNAGNTAAQTVYQGNGNQVAYNAYNGAPVQFSGTYEQPAYIADQQAPAGTINGQQYSQEAYSEARAEMAQQQRAQEQARRNATRKSQEDAAARNTQQPDLATAAGLNTTATTQAGMDQQAQTEERGNRQRKPRQQNKAVEVSMISAEDVADSNEPLESQPTTSSENLGYVDTDTGEVVSTTPSRTYTNSRVKEPKPRGRKRKAVSVAPGSAMVEAMKTMDKEINDGNETKHVTPSEIQASIESMSQEDMDRMHDRLVLNNAARNFVDPTPLEAAWAKAKKTYLEERRDDEIERDAIRRENNPGDNYADNSESWTINQNLEGAKTNKERLERIRQYDTQRTQPLYDEVAEIPQSMEGRGFDKQTQEHHPWMETEDKIRNKFAKARNEILRRLINPSLLRIQSEHVETVKEGKGKNAITKGRIRYSEEVEHAIQNIVNLYDCSIRDVMQLVQLRAGLGVDLKGKIGGKKANKFKLSDAQFIELCHDIERSQQRYGHPMAIVEGTPGENGVRDDSGKFVVVANTRCFPMGYVPRSIINNLMKNDASVLHGQSVDQIQNMINGEWLRKTYPNILANASGNAMWQARALENMMRAVMSMDGVNPSNLEIPEIKVNRTLMQMAAEKSLATDPDIRRANDERERREIRHCEEFRHRYMKNNGGRNSDGSINSPSRRRNWVGDVLGGISRFGQLSKAADIFMIITNPIEAMQAMTEQNVGNWMLGKIFDAQNKDVSKNYQVTETLAAAATSDEGVEARDVAESLYRIGGWAAIDAFVSELGDNGRYKYKMTNADLRKFLQDYGVVGSGTPEALMKRLGIKPGQEAGFMSNVQGIINSIDDWMLGGSGIFKEKEAGQFAKLAMMEMARSSVRNEESYTSTEVEEWAARGGGEEMMRNFLRTEAGREAFMTQGITSIGRKSPWDYAIRQVMAKNRFTELLVRTCFDRFPEYGMNKIMRQIPASNTLSYLGSYAVNGVGRMLELVGGEDVAPVTNAGQALQRAGEYQAGRRNGFVEGLFKNLMYDSVMAVNKLMIACVYWGVLQLLGGLQPPPDDDDKYNWSEWIIGNYEKGLPIKWAWWMDDLSGIGLPLGAAFAIAQQGDWSPEARDTASKTFMNAVANFNDGTALFDAFELFNNFDDEMQEAMGNGEVGAWLQPTIDEKRQTSLELMAWKFLGDMTPSIVKQVLPWSRDFLFRDDYYARSASKVYNTDEYSISDAQKEYRLKSVGDYHDYMMRREAQNNPVAAIIMDLIWGAGGNSDKTGYTFDEQPIRSEVDPLAQLMWNKYSLDKSKLSRNPEEAKQQAREWGEYICNEIDANFKDPADALAKGFIMNPEARMACQEYCNWMMYDQIPAARQAAIDDMREKMGMYYIPQDTYDNIVQTYKNQEEHYRMLYENYFSGSSEIPWRLPRYGILDSDIETRYLDENGNAAVNPLMAGVANFLGMNVTPGEADKYSYGNIPNSLPFYSPQRTGLFAQQSRPYWLREGVENDTQGLYDMLSNAQNAPLESLPGMTPEEAAAWRQQAAATQDQLFGGHGREAMPTSGQRGLEPLNQTMPDSFKTYYDPDQVSKALGFDAFDKDKAKSNEGEGEDKDKSSKPGSSYLSYGYGGGRSYSYGGRSYYGGGGGGGYSSSYNPKIYSTPRQVNGDRASGLQIRQPYKATSTYLRPNFYTKGSREAYKRSDI